MKMKLVLSFLLLTVCMAVFSQENGAITEKGLVKVSIMYPYAEGKTFNMEYYEKKHMPMVAGYLGSNLVKYTIEKGVTNSILTSIASFSSLQKQHFFQVDPLLQCRLRC